MDTFSFFIGAAIGLGYSPSYDLPPGTIETEKRSGAIGSIYGGLTWKFIELEGGYQELSRIHTEGFNDGSDGHGIRQGKQDITASGIYGRIGFRIKATQTISVTPFVGRMFVTGHSHEAQTHFTPPPIYYAERTDSTKDRVPYFGIKTNYDLNKNWALRAEVSTVRNTVKSDHTFKQSYNLLQIGFERKF